MTASLEADGFYVDRTCEECKTEWHRRYDALKISRKRREKKMATSKTRKVSTARAKVQLTLELDAGSCWGADTSLSQIYDQAERETLNKVERIFGEAGVRVYIVGKPVITAISAVETK